MDSFADALSAIDDMKRDGVVSEYAVGGAMALIFWSEPAATFDLDVFVLLEQRGALVSLDAIYTWARERGYPEQHEHIVIAGIPVQVIPAHNALAEEAIVHAASLEYEGRPVRVIRPEYLVAMALEGSARSRKRLERVATLMDEGNLDQALLAEILNRYHLQLPRQAQ